MKNLTDKMQALVLYDVEKMELRSVPAPKPTPQDILLRVRAVGLCGSDFHIFSGVANYNKDRRGQAIPLVEQPQILGHEIVGVVESVGPEVPDLQVGDRVILDQGLNCLSQRRKNRCEYCASGDSHQCEFYKELGITGVPGGLAEYLAIPAVNAIKIGDLENERAALTEPLSCIVHASDRVRRLNTRYLINPREPDRRVQSILIFGAGIAGILFIQYLRNILGYDGLLLVSEPSTEKHSLVERFGAEAIDPNKVDIVEAVKSKTNGRGVEYIIDACGAGSILKTIPRLMRKQATLLLYGYGHSGVDLTVLNDLQFMEGVLVTSTGGSGGFDPDGRPSTYRQALEILEAKQIDTTNLITHRYHSLAAVPQAFTGDHQLPNYIKGVAVL